MSDEQKTFAHWCIVELMGHQTVAGMVTEEHHFGVPLMRVDIPDTEQRAGFTKYYGPTAIYAVTPVEEKIARAVSQAHDSRPVSEWQLRRMLPEPEYPADEREYKHLMSEEYGSDDERQPSDDLTNTDGILNDLNDPLANRDDLDSSCGE